VSCRRWFSRPQETLTLDRTTTVFIADLRHRGIDFDVPSDPLADRGWILFLQRIYAYPTATPRYDMQTMG
jgi:hypothetical protein